jgi:pyrroloquinoline quinone biosynthesis protein E
MKLSVKKHARHRREAFGGIIMNPLGRVFFVTDEVISALGCEEAPSEMAQFLARVGVVESVRAADMTDPQKYLLGELRIAEDTRHLSSPLVLTLVVTRNCSLECPHCAVALNADSKNELTTDEVFLLLEQARAMDVFAISLTGGEPLVREDLPAVIEHASAIGIRVTILTNGLLLSESLLDGLPDNVSLLISVDGMAHGYDYFRGAANRDLIMKNIELVRSRGLGLALTCMFTKVNRQETRATLEHFMINSGIPVIPTPVLPLGRARLHPEILLDATDADEFVALKRLKREYYKGCPSTHAQEIVGFGIDDLTEVFESAFWACSGTRIDLAIDSDGTAYPCVNCLCTGSFPLGELRNLGLRGIWLRSSETDRFRDITWDCFEKCSNCSLTEHCNFRCPALSLQAHGQPLICGADTFTREVIRLGIQANLTDRLR